MSYAPRRAALLSLCVLAILLAASLFPATGFGTVPNVAAPPPSAPDGPATDTGPTTDASPTTTDDPVAETTTGSTTDQPTTAPTTASTATTTDGAATADPSGGDGDGAGPGGVFWTVAVVLSALFPIGFALLLHVLGYRRRGWWLESEGEYDLPDLPPPRVRAAIQSLPRTTMGLVMGLSASVPDLLDGLGTVVRESADGAAMVLDGVAAAFGQLAVGLPTALARGLGAFGRGLGAALGGLPSVFVSLGGGLGDRDWPSFGGWSSDEDDSRRTRDAHEAEEPPPPRTVEEAWARMTDSVHVRNRRAATPTDYARAAVARGYPERAVQRLTRLFQEVRYGGLSGDERTDAALDAFERFRQHADGGEES